MAGYTGRYGWVLLIAVCLSLPFQVWADTEISEKMRFERQAQAAEADTEAGVPAERTREQPVTGQDAQEEEYVADAEFEDDIFIELKEGVLSVDVQDIPFNRVLTTVAERGEFRILFIDPAQEPLTIAFTALPLKRGIEELLGDRDHMFRYSGDNGALSTVVVYTRKADTPRQPKKHWPPPQLTAKDEGDPTAQDELDVTLLSAQALGNSDEDERLEAVEGLTSLEDQEEAADILTAVLQEDANSNVREAALESLADFDNPDSQRRAAHLSIDDSEPAIRMRAVEILTAIEDWEALRDLATGHDDPEVRALASDALEDGAH